jgi:hypothetical protein
MQRFRTEVPVPTAAPSRAKRRRLDVRSYSIRIVPPADRCVVQSLLRALRRACGLYEGNTRPGA